MNISEIADIVADDIIEELAAVIGKRPCERCKQSNPEPSCFEHDCQNLYREEAKDVLMWLIKSEDVK